METTLSFIYDFWNTNPQMWINFKKENDILIKNKFYIYYDAITSININITTKEHLVAVIIYLDQFSRHFQKLNLITEEDVMKNRNKAVELFSIYYSKYSYDMLNEFDMVFMLMVLKHVNLERFGKFILLEINNYTNFYKIKISNMKILNKFFEDTYQKVYDNVDLIKYEPKNTDNNFNEFSNVCDKYDKLVIPNEKIKEINIYKNIKKYLENNKINNIIISLSGGVDSNLIAYLLSVLNTKINIKLLHIVYGNRLESFEELEFLKKYASNLNLDLYVYHIPFLRRNYNNRSFYETMTRKLRFNCYKKLDNNPIVALGHIKDDVIENIITNFCSKKELFNLKKMNTMMVQDGVNIYRPFLEIEKNMIYKYSDIFQIPYLKNTTPLWSNRGKFRNSFYPSLVEQYGKQIDNTLMYNAEIYKSYDNIIKELLIKPFYESIIFDNNQLNANYGLFKNQKLPIHLWNDIFEHIFYNYFKINKPSNSSITNFVEQINKNKSNFKCHLTKNFIVYINNDNLMIKI